MMFKLMLSSMLFSASAAVADVKYVQSVNTGPWGTLVCTEYFDDSGRTFGGYVVEVHSWRIVQ